MRTVFKFKRRIIPHLNVMGPIPKYLSDISTESYRNKNLSIGGIDDVQGGTFSLESQNVPDSVNF